MRQLVVGDIHGGFRALKEVMEQVKPTKNDTFIFVGDYVDGWSENAETVAYLIEFSENYNCVFIRGNHDVLLHDYLSGKETGPMWIEHGGRSSIDSYAKLSEEEISEHIKFFENLENFYIDEDNKLFLHAGFTDQKGPQFEYFPNTVYWDRTLWEMVCALDPNISKDDEKYPKRLSLFKQIYIGHTPVTRIGHTKPVTFANVTNVDTGAAFKGPVSVLETKTGALFQSAPVHILYPEEEGRN